VELDHAELAGGWAVGVSIRSAALHAVDLSSSELEQLHILDATLRGCRLQLTFEDCVLTQTDFLQSELQSVRFHGCDLTQADFRGAQLDRCELRGCELEGAHGIERLAGSAMPWADIVQHAGTWAAALGIEVLDEE
jgi:uncharacterized protein YjbI with pentapeptide repeats